MNFFTSDLHFGHKAIIHMCKRPFVDINEMHNKLITNWNSKVTDSDTVYCLGDMFYKCSNGTQKYILNELKGEIIFIKGNHDYKNINKISWRFKEVRDLLMIHDEFINRKLFLSHYAMEGWCGKYRGVYSIHGDSHGTSEVTNQNVLLRHDVGVDCNKFNPISSIELETIMKNKKEYSKYYGQ